MEVMVQVQNIIWNLIIVLLGGEFPWPLRTSFRELSDFKKTMGFQILWLGSGINVLQDILSFTVIPLKPYFTQLSSIA